MTSQASSVAREQRVPRFVLFGLFLSGGLSIYVLGNNWNDLFPTNTSTFYKAALPIVFLVLAVFLRRSERLRPYWRIAFALFIGAFATWLNWMLGDWLARLLPAVGSTAQALAIDKLSQCIPVALSMIALTLLVHDDLGSIFLMQGDLREGLKFGLISFGICAGIFATIALVQANAPAGQGLTAGGVSLSTIVAAIPWILVFVFANSLMEELWFRGIYLKKLTPFLGVAGTIGVTSLVFGLSHIGATYISPIERLIFPVVVFILGVVNAHWMLKTDSIVGSLLFHAGYDLIIIIPVIVSAQ